MRRRITCFCLLLLLLQNLSAQISRGGRPMLTRMLKSAAPPFGLSSEYIHNEILKIADDRDALSGKKPLTIAVDQRVSLDPENSGKWYFPGNGYRIWRLEVFSENAEALSVYFDEFNLEVGVMLFLYDPSFNKVLGGFNHLNNKKSGIFQTGFIPGEKLVLELQVPEHSKYGRVRIGSFSHAFVDIYNRNRTKDGYYGLSGNCEVDINCSGGAAWQIIKRAVCRIIFKRDGFTTEICTGALVNNTAQDEKPYFYTANHCIRSSFEAQTAIFYFGYESVECDGPDGVTAMSLSGSEVLATSDSLDFSLLLLSESPPEAYLPYYAGWTSTSDIPLSTVTIHHPRGDVKKISVDRDPALTEYQKDNPPSWLYAGSIPGAFWRIEDWETGATESASSGCPLFNQAKLIVGNLTGGDASCLYPYDDYFSKFFMNWNFFPEPGRQLKYWLDSLNTGQEFIEGYDPYNLPDPNEIDIFDVYPNPSTGFVTLYTDTLDLYNASVKIYNINGSTVADYSIKDVESTTFDFSRFENGFYIIEVRIQGYLERKKIVLAR